MPAESDDFFRMPPGVRAIQAELAAHQWPSLNEANAFLARRTAEYNAAPQAELGGLTPEEMFELLNGDWETTGPLRLNADLPLPDLLGSAFLKNGRHVLSAAAERNGIRATAAGNLNRQFVATLLDPDAWPGSYVQEVIEHSKVVNEADLWPLHILRVVLEVAGLLTRRADAFRATRGGRELLDDARAGALQARLFRTFFRAFNLAYLSRYGADEADPIQRFVAFCLLRLTTVGSGWHPAHELAPQLLPSDALAHDERPVDPERQPRDQYERDIVAACSYPTVRYHVLRPLEWFGLLQGRDRPGPLPAFPFQDVRRTPLFDRFIHFPEPFRQAARRRLG
jgi:hypothetical protein